MIHRSPDDEVLLTELQLDHLDLTVYDISSCIIVGEKIEKNAFKDFSCKCYMDHQNKDFFIELTATQFEYFTRNTLLKILNIAESEDSNVVYACFRKDTHENSIDLEKYIKSLLFIGFKSLDENESKKISMTKTHMILSYDIK